METKICGCCGIEYPKTKDYFFTKTHTSNIDDKVSHYFRSVCKKCHSKLGTRRKHIKRFKELKCNDSNYKEKWTEQIALKHLKHKQLVGIPQTKRSYISKKIDNGYVFTSIEKYNNDIWDNIEKRALKSRKYNYSNFNKLSNKDCNDMQTRILTDAKIANILRVPIKELPLEIIELQRSIILMKRELGLTNLK